METLSNGGDLTLTAEFGAGEEGQCEGLEGIVLGTQYGCSPRAKDTGCSPMSKDVGNGKELGMNCTPRRSPRLLDKRASLEKAASQTADGLDTRAPVSDHAEPPAVGMVFDTMLEVEAFYKKYSQQQGFGIARPQGSYSKSRERTATTWRCEAWGDPEGTSKTKSRRKAKEMQLGGIEDADEVVGKKRNTKKCFCTAMVYASMNEGRKWVIRKVVLEHFNHQPTPEHADLVKEYRMKHLTKGVKRRPLNDYEVGVPVAKIHSGLVKERAGYDNVPLTEKDLRHVVNANRRLKMEGGDANALVNYFERMQQQNLNFFHSHRLDWEGKMKDVLWVDARSQAVYEEFCDAVYFDTSYLTNEYALPFANFVGVNHHGQSVLLGCALISNEDCDTFEWVFRQWLLCMKGKQPGGILTDQAAAMRRPLEDVMPKSCHRWCLWHILQKLPYKLAKHERYEELKKELLDIVYNSLNSAKFERDWQAMIENYKLEDNEWLANLFNERHMWVPSFMNDHFWAGMRTTQLVESINSFFD